MASLVALEADPRDALAMALAGLGRAIDERESEAITGVHRLPRNIARDSKDTGADRVAASEPAPVPPGDDLEAAKQHWIAALLSNGGSG
jgi:hypothetical protein